MIDDEGGEDVECAEDVGGSEDASYSTVPTVLLFAAAIFGAFVAIKKVIFQANKLNK